MSVSPVLIDLGEVSRLARPGDLDTEEVPGWTPGQNRAAGLLMALVLTLVAAAGSVPAEPPLAVGSMPTESRDMVLYGDDQYLVFHPGDVPSERTVTAYRLPDGEQLWRVPVPSNQIGWLTQTQPTQTQPTPTGPTQNGTGTAVLISETGGPAEREPGAVAAATGRVLYRAGGQVFGLLRGGNVVLWSSPGGEFGVEIGGRRLLARGAVTGHVRWSYTAPPGAWLWWDPTDGGLSSAAVLLPSGRMELLDLERGVRIASAVVSPPREPSEPSAVVQVVGDLLLVEGSEGGRVRATAYGRQRLDRRWTVTMDLFGEYVAPCGPRLCVGTLAGGGVRTLAAATGETMWSAPWWSFLEPVGAPVGGRLLAGPPGARGDGTGLVLLDPETGQVTADLGHWLPVWPVPVGSDPIVIRHDLRASHSWYGRIDVRRGRVQVVGSVTGITDECRADGGYLSCFRPDGSIGTWRVPRL